MKTHHWPFFSKNCSQKSQMTPTWTLTPTSVEVTYETLPKDHCVQLPWKYIEVWIQWPFLKTFTKRLVTPRWPLTPLLLRSHVWLNPSIIVSKSHANTSKYVDTVIIKKKKKKKKKRKTLTKRSMTPNDPYTTFDPTSVEVTCATLPKNHCVQFPYGNTSKCVDTVTIFFN